MIYPAQQKTILSASVRSPKTIPLIVFLAVDTGLLRDLSKAGGESTPPRICRHCRAEFDPVKVNQTFCSHPCKDLFNAVPKALRAIDRYLVTVSEAAVLTKRKPWQIRYEIRRGKLDSVLVAKRLLMVRLSDLLPGHKSATPSTSQYFTSSAE
jgi:hypothetical protein